MSGGFKVCQSLLLLLLFATRVRAENADERVAKVLVQIFLYDVLSVLLLLLMMTHHHSVECCLRMLLFSIAIAS